MAKGFIADFQRFTITPCTYEPKRVDDLYFKVNGKDLIPIAYIFPEESKDALVEKLKELEKLKIEYDKAVARIYYKELPKLR